MPHGVSTLLPYYFLNLIFFLVNKLLEAPTPYHSGFLNYVLLRVISHVLPPNPTEEHDQRHKARDSAHDE